MKQAYWKLGRERLLGSVGQGGTQCCERKLRARRSQACRGVYAVLIAQIYQRFLSKSKGQSTFSKDCCVETRIGRAWAWKWEYQLKNRIKWRLNGSECNGNRDVGKQTCTPTKGDTSKTWSMCLPKCQDFLKISLIFFGTV